MKRYSSKKLLLTVVAIITVLTVAAITPVQAYAKVTFTSSSKADSKNKSERYFSDVKNKSHYRSEVEWLAKYGAFKSIAKKGGKFKPNQVITRKQVAIILNNLYGDRIDLTVKDPNKKATQKFVTTILTTTSKQLGHKVTWSGGAPKAKVTRAKACHYTYQMIGVAKEGVLHP